MLNLTGKRFNRLRVLSFSGKTEYGNIKWLCQCDCGNIVNVRSESLTNKLTKSCGCLRSETSRRSLKQRAKQYINENNHRWKGDKVGIIAAHVWINKNKTKPPFCQRCKERPARELSYKYSKGWSRNPEDYEYLCNSCHRLKDIGNGAKPMDNTRIREIRRLYDIGLYGRRKLAEIFKVSRSNIDRIIKYQGIYAE